MNRAPGFAAALFPTVAAFRRALFLRAAGAVFGLNGISPPGDSIYSRLSTLNAA